MSHHYLFLILLFNRLVLPPIPLILCLNSPCLLSLSFVCIYSVGFDIFKTTVIVTLWAWWMVLMVFPQERRDVNKAKMRWRKASALSCSRLHHERSHLRVGWKRSRSGGRWADATSVHPEGGEGPALLHQTLQHRWVQPRSSTSTRWCSGVFWVGSTWGWLWLTERSQSFLTEIRSSAISQTAAGGISLLERLLVTWISPSRGDCSQSREASVGSDSKSSSSAIRRFEPECKREIRSLPPENCCSAIYNKPNFCVSLHQLTGAWENGKKMQQ